MRLSLPALLLIPAASHARDRLEYVTFGPMLHWNFSDKAFHSFSFGLEAAYWNYRRDLDDDVWGTRPDESPGFGLDLGLEFDRRGIRVYSEPQVGWIWAGMSLGPVVELPLDGAPLRMGFQGSGWLNAMLGVDVRARRLGGKTHVAPGVYAKLGKLVSGARPRRSEERGLPSYFFCLSSSAASR